jgi:leucyl/phenylalanyl-tRNA--protein transferase
MAVYMLNNSILMPPPELSEADGLLAIGGDLSSSRLVGAYKMGIFPWYNEGEEIFWWSPDPRFVLFPDDLKISKSMRKLIERKHFEVSYNKNFEGVIAHCKNISRSGQEGTWITDEMEESYIKLNHEGIAHSIEVWDGEELVGGLYGLKIGKVFFGESMFSLKSNASKFAFIHWVKKLQVEGCKIIDCQIATEHLRSLGANEIPRKRFLKILKNNIEL